MKKMLARCGVLVAVVVSLAALPPSVAESKVSYPDPKSFKIDAPFSMGKVDLADSIFDGKEKWGGNPKCKLKSSGTVCKWGNENSADGMALMYADGDINSHLNTILIEFGSKNNGQPIINQASPLTKFFTTRGKVSLGSSAQRVADIDPASMQEFGGGFFLTSSTGARMFFLTGGPNDKFVTGIVLTDQPI